MKKIVVGKSPIHQQGVLAGEPIKKGDKIQYINGEKSRWVTRNANDSKQIENWIGLGRHSWINTEGTPFRFINHSCDPSAAIMGTKTVVALKDIAEGEEITIDYSMTDADPHWYLDCECKSENCRKQVGPIMSIPPEVFRNHMPHIPRFFQRIYLRTYIAKTLGIEK